MDIKLEWLKPIELKDGFSEDLIYTCNEDHLPEEPGIYIFARRFGKKVSPLYIGQARNLKREIRSKFKTTKLMIGMQKAQIGTRMLMLAKLKPARGRRDLKKPLDMAEQACIDYALSNGFDILNKRGTKTPVHHIESDSPKKLRDPFPSAIHIKRR